MTTLSDVLRDDDLRTLASLQVLARTVVEGLSTGLHRSPNKGASVEFRQHRQYVPGDEIRRLDWKVYGKRDRLYIREYEEETSLRATLLVDVSGSMAYGAKHEYALRLAACLAYLMLQQGDSVGLVTFDTKVRKHLPPRSNPGHLRLLLDTLAGSKVGGETSLARVFHTLAPLFHRRGLLIVISDCFSEVADLAPALAELRHDHHEVIVLQLWDRSELDFPFKGWTRFESLEDTTQHRLVDPAHMRAAYLAKLATFREDLRKACHRHRVELAPLVTDQPYAEALARFISLRMPR